VFSSRRTFVFSNNHPPTLLVFEIIFLPYEEGLVLLWAFCPTARPIMCVREEREGSWEPGNLQASGPAFLQKKIGQDLENFEMNQNFILVGRAFGFDYFSDSLSLGLIAPASRLARWPGDFQVPAGPPSLFSKNK
jgi:hypothetical protein